MYQRKEEKTMRSKKWILVLLGLCLIFHFNCAKMYYLKKRYNHNIEDTRNAVKITMKKIDYEVSETNTIQRGEYQYWDIYKGIHLEYKKEDEQSTVIKIGSEKKHVNFIMSDIIRQELNKDYGNNQLKPKSYLLYNFLNILTPVLGGAYLSTDNPYAEYKSSIGNFLIGLLTEGFLTWQFGSYCWIKKFEFKNALPFLIGWRVLLGISGNINIGYYNDLAYSGYSFRF